VVVWCVVELLFVPCVGLWDGLVAGGEKSSNWPKNAPKCPPEPIVVVVIDFHVTIHYLLITPF